MRLRTSIEPQLGMDYGQTIRFALALEAAGESPRVSWTLNYLGTS